MVKTSEHEWLGLLHRSRYIQDCDAPNNPGGRKVPRAANIMTPTNPSVWWIDWATRLRPPAELLVWLYAQSSPPKSTSPLKTITSWINRPSSNWSVGHHGYAWTPGMYLASVCLVYSWDRLGIQVSAEDLRHWRPPACRIYELIYIKMNDRIGQITGQFTRHEVLEIPKRQCLQTIPVTL